MQTAGVLLVHLPPPLALPLYARLGLMLPAGVAILALITGLCGNLSRPGASRTNFYTS
jgi:hypothetical protein